MIDMLRKSVLFNAKLKFVKHVAAAPIPLNSIRAELKLKMGEGSTHWSEFALENDFHFHNSEK
jgi:hypothetical protein